MSEECCCPFFWSPDNPTYTPPTPPLPSLADLYVDSTALDGMNGTTEYTPLNSIAALMTKTGGNLTGKTIAFKRGSIFPEELVSALCNDLKIIAYGDPAQKRALIDCRDVVTGFTETGGAYPNVWQKDIITTGSVKNQINVSRQSNPADNETDYMLVYQPTIALCNSTPLSYHIPSSNVVNATIYINPRTELATPVDPNTDGAVYRYTRREIGWNLAGVNMRINDVAGKGNSAEDGVFKLVGFGTLVGGLECLDGNRHVFFGQGNITATRSRFRRGRNGTESYLANSAVINSTSIAGYKPKFSLCEFDGWNGDPYSGPFGHGSVEADLYDEFTIDRCDFRNMGSCFTSKSQHTICISPRMTNCKSFASWGDAGNFVDATDPRGTVNQLVNASASGRLLCTGGDVTILSCPSGVFRSDAPTNPATIYDIVGTKFFIRYDPTLTTNITSTNPRFIYQKNGSSSMNGVEIYPIVCSLLNHVVYVGSAAMPVTYAGANNKVPRGSRWRINDNEYENLAAVQAAGYEAGTTYHDLPPEEWSDAMAGGPNVQLTTRPHWILASGSAAALVVDNDALKIATLSAAYAYYDIPLTSDDFWVEFMIGGPVASPGSSVMIRSDITGQNGFSLRWTATAWQFGKLKAGVFTPAVWGSAWSVTPAADMKVWAGMIGDRLWVIANDVMLVVGQAMGEPGFTGAAHRYVGIRGAGPVMPYFIKNLRAGSGLTYPAIPATDHHNGFIQ